MSASQLDPLDLFNEWFELAKANEPSDVDAASIATVDQDGQPSIRIVLIRAIDQNGFTFYTNLGSRKALEIVRNPRMALCFHWKSIAKQIRVEGRAKQVADSVADEYFASRPRESQIGAWASKQSTVLSSRVALESRFQDLQAQYEGKVVARPPFWSGFQLTPAAFEFWDKREFRLHDRQRFQKTPEGWQRDLLYP